MKKLIGISTFTIGLALSTLAFADQPSPPPGNSQSGIERYNNNPGRQQATAVGAQRTAIKPA